jgi:RNA polymerase sigma-70 factor, ECF subfamily
MFAVLVERHTARVFRLVSSLLGPHAAMDAEQVTQDVFLRACERIDSFRGESRFGTWLYRIAYNLTIEYRRHMRLSAPHVSDENLLLVADGDSPDSFADQQHERLVAALVEQLPDPYRAAVNLRYWHDLEVDEVAALLNVTPNTAKSYLFRARELLRRLARQRGIEP